MNRAYSLLDIKSVDDEKRIIEGIATTPTPDRYKDVVEPMGMEFKLPLPFLYQHNSKQPIGTVTAAKVSKDGISARIQIAPSGIAPFIDEAWSLIKAGLIRGLSIGFRSLEDTFDRETGGIHFLKSEWLELSAVTVAANQDATITSIKSADALLLAASGRKREVVRLDSTHNRPGVSGTPGKTPMTIKEQIAKFEATRAASTARMEAIMAKGGDEGRTLDATESEEYDTLEKEVAAVDEHMVRLKRHEQTLVSKAVDVTPEVGRTPKSSAETRGGVVQVTRNLPKGAAFARYIIALHMGQGNRRQAAEIARQHCPDTPEVEMVLKTEVTPGTTTGATWALPLMPAAQTLYGEFIELLRPATILGRLPNVRYVPFRVNVPAQTTGATFGWVGELAPKPVSAAAFDTVSLDFNKVAGIVPMSKELLKFSNPQAEQVITNSMVRDAADFLDSQLLDPAVHVSTGVQPASLTSGVIPKTASGLTAAAFRADLAVCIATFIAVYDDPRKIVILMSATIALNMSLIRNALGQKEFPDLTVNGGSVEGFPVIVSQAVGARVVFLNSSDVLVADGSVEIDMSQEASIVMTTTPASSPAATELVSLFQKNMVAIRVEKFITWKKARTTTCAYIQTAVYSG